MSSTRASAALFYLGCAVILVVMMTGMLTQILPVRLAHQISDESEAFPIVIFFCAYVQFVRNTVSGSTRSRWITAAALAALSWLIAWLLLTLSLPSSVVTLNESFVAIGAMILYATLERPLPWAPMLTAAMIVVIALLNSTHVVTAQVESLIPIALMPIAFDWADQTILDRTATVHPLRRALWCVLIVVVPIVARWHVDIGSWHDIFSYERRATEGFLALLLIHLYFSLPHEPMPNRRPGRDLRSTGDVGEVTPRHRA